MDRVERTPPTEHERAIQAVVLGVVLGVVMAIVARSPVRGSTA